MSIGSQTDRTNGGESSKGLGLSIVKRLAEAMAGTAHCQSRLGEGSTFSLRLPVAKITAANSALRIHDEVPNMNALSLR